MSNPIEEFFAGYPFAPDPFQVDAVAAWEAGLSVVVSAPTGSGKTVVAEYAVSRALERGAKAFYTTPLKALSNQKFGDFTRRYGAHRVGLLTGDNSVNAAAPVVVMTTEVLRNMIYEDSSRLDRLEAVVLDEVHYLQDRSRGAIWEEVIIHLPPTVRLVCLSATVSNADEFAEWVATLRGPTRAVVTAGRPVPLHQSLLFGDKASDELVLIPLFAGVTSGAAWTGAAGDPAAATAQLATDLRPHPALAKLEDRSRRGAGGRRRQPLFAPRRVEVVDVLEDRSMLPAIVFVFSRAGCDAAVDMCLRAGIRLIGPGEREAALGRLDERVGGLDDAELDALGYGAFAAGLGAGIAGHHAGLIPAFKEAVEDCFAAGLTRLVFATETLSLGINMPARTVVIERLSKFTGDGHELLTPAQYTQLTGRAGRRGIDELGHAVVLWSPWVPAARVAGLAGAMSFPLTSSFKPDYNMAANLIRRYSRGEAEELLNSSFAQFRTDRDLVRSEATLTRRRRTLEAYRETAACELGDVIEYRALGAATRSKADRAAAAPEDAVRLMLGRARAGDVLYFPGVRGHAIGVVVGKARSRSGLLRLSVVAKEARLIQIGPRDLTASPVRLGTIDLPVPLALHSAKYRRGVADLIARFERPGAGHPAARSAERDIAGSDDRASQPVRLEDHPVHTCPDRDRHIGYLERADDLEREIDRLDARLRRRSDALTRVFERVVTVLDRLGYVDGWSLTGRGETLASLYTEVDLLVTECLVEGVFDELDPAEVAALASCLTFEPRGDDAPGPVPGGARVRGALRRARTLWRDISALEEEAGIAETREPHEGFADPIYRWARGERLDDILAGDDLTGGDFVRQAKQVVDLLRQLALIDEAAPFSAAADALERGVVAYSSV